MGFQGQQAVVMVGELLVLGTTHVKGRGLGRIPLRTSDGVAHQVIGQPEEDINTTE